MKISAFSSANYNNNLMKNNLKETNKKSNVSFKSVYLDGFVDLGRASCKSVPARFLPSDEYALRKIEQQYPNQDCFICKGRDRRPCLMYRETPVRIPYYNPTRLADVYKLEINPNDKDYPCEPLILDKDSDLNIFIGMPSYISTNPSLIFTIKVGFELHKELMKKKALIEDALGNNEDFNLGEESIVKLAHKEIKETETAVIRYLMECAYAALSDRASAEQIYKSDYPKIQSILKAEREYDLTTSTTNRPKIKNNDNSGKEENKEDFCQSIVNMFPDYEENVARIEELKQYMNENSLFL